MRRIYREARAVPAEGGYRIELDGRPVRTPAGAPLTLPNAALAEAVAGEWNAQGERVAPLTMPLTRFASTVIDRVRPQRAAVLEEVARYAETDLVCYRAEAPAELVGRQQALWQPLVDWAVLRFDAPLLVASGVLPRRQPASALAALRAAVEALDDMRLMALHTATTAAGSLVIGLALLEGRLSPEDAWSLSQLDESFQIERWGEDAEAARRRQALRQEIADAWRLATLLGR